MPSPNRILPIRFNLNTLLATNAITTHKHKSIVGKLVRLLLAASFGLQTLPISVADARVASSDVRWNSDARTAPDGVTKGVVSDVYNPSELPSDIDSPAIAPTEAVSRLMANTSVHDVRETMKLSPPRSVTDSAAAIPNNERTQNKSKVRLLLDLLEEKGKASGTYELSIGLRASQKQTESLRIELEVPAGLSLQMPLPAGATYSATSRLVSLDDVTAPKGRKPLAVLKFVTESLAARRSYTIHGKVKDSDAQILDVGTATVKIKDVRKSRPLRASEPNTIVVADGIKIDFAPGALPADTEITSQASGDFETSSTVHSFIVRGFEMGPDMTFNAPVTLTMSISDMKRLGGKEGLYYVYGRVITHTADEVLAGDPLTETIMESEPIPFTLDSSGILTAVLPHFSNINYISAVPSPQAPPAWTLKFQDSSVSEFDGGFSWNHPFALPPGPGGIGAPLALSYSSRRMDGILSTAGQMAGYGTTPATSPFPDTGLGWDIDIPEIAWSNFHPQIEPANGTWGWSAWDPTWSIRLNGSSTRIFSTQSHPDWWQYQVVGCDVPEEAYVFESGAQWRAKWICGPTAETRDSQSYWEVKTPDGIKYRFGLSPDSRQMLGWGRTEANDWRRRIIRWRLSEVIYPHTPEKTTYSYYETRLMPNCCAITETMDYQSYIREINYPGTRVVFNWSSAPDGSTVEGVSNFTSPNDFAPLQNLQVFQKTSSGAWNEARRWEFSYVTNTFGTAGTDDDARTLTSIVEKANGLALPATSFGYVWLANKGGDCGNHCGNGSFGPKTYEYPRVRTINNGYGAVITATYETPDSGWWQSWNYRVKTVRTTNGMNPPDGWQDNFDYSNRRCYKHATHWWHAWGNADFPYCRSESQFDAIYRNDVYDYEEQGLTGGGLVGYQRVAISRTNLGGQPIRTTATRFSLSDDAPAELRSGWYPGVFGGGPDTIGVPWQYLGRPITQQVIAPDNQIVAETRNIWSGAIGYTRTQPHHPRHIQFLESRVWLAQSESTKDGVTTRNRYAYDVFGQVTKQVEEGNIAVLGDERSTHSGYIFNSDRWMSKLSFVNLYDGIVESNADGPALRRQAHLNYDDHTGNAWDGGAFLTRGLLSRARVGYFGTDATRLISTEQRAVYDTWGNQTEFWNNGRREAETNYDAALHLYPITQTNALGQAASFRYYCINEPDTTCTPGQPVGALHSVKDPNQIAVQSVYDAFGRLNRVVKPGDTVSRPSEEYVYSDAWGDVAPMRVLHRVRSKSGTGAQGNEGWNGYWFNAVPTTDPTYEDPNITAFVERTFYDGLGRVIQTQRSDGNWFAANGNEIVSDTSYDALGRVVTQSVPYTVSKSAPRGPNYMHVPDLSKMRSTTVYDVFGRATRSVGPDGTTSGMAYGINAVTAIDGNGHFKNSFQDGLGRTFAVDEVLHKFNDNFSSLNAFTAAGNVFALAGAAHLNGDNTWGNHVLRPFTLGNNQGVIVDFIVDGASTADTVFIQSGNWEQPDYRRWGLLISNSTIYLDEYAGLNHTVTPMLGLKKGTWYRVYLSVGDGTRNFMAHVWERENPGTGVQRRQVQGADWINRTYQFMAQTLTGTMRLEKYAEADFNRTAYGYDVFDNLVTVQDKLNNSTVITYDGLGRKTGMRDPDMGTWAYSYDAFGNLERQTDNLNRIQSFKYDSLNRMTEKWLGNINTGTKLAAYTYDEPGMGASIGKRTRAEAFDAEGYAASHRSQSFDFRGRPDVSLTSIQAISFETRSTYDAADRVVSVRYPDNEVLTTTYNAAGQPVALISSLGETYANTTTYNALGLPTFIKLGNGLNQFYRYMEWPGSAGYGKLHHTCVTTATSCFVFSHDTDIRLNFWMYYDRAGNVTDFNDVSLANPGPNHANSEWDGNRFTYDSLGRLIGWTNSPPGPNPYVPVESYAYDAIGNLTSKGGISATYSASGPASVRPHAIVSRTDGSSFQYDANGNMTVRTEVSGTQVTTYLQEWNIDNKLVAMTNTLTGEVGRYWYDADGVRVRKEDSDGGVIYVGGHFEHVYSAGPSYPSPALSNTDELTVTTRRQVGFAVPRFTASTNARMHLYVGDLGGVGADVYVHNPSGDYLTHTRVLTGQAGAFDFATQIPGGLPQTGQYSVTVKPLGTAAGRYHVSVAHTEIQSGALGTVPFSVLAHALAITRPAQDGMVVFTALGGTDVEVATGAGSLPSSVSVNGPSGPIISPEFNEYSLATTGNYSVYFNPANNAKGVIDSQLIVLPPRYITVPIGIEDTQLNILRRRGTGFATFTGTVQERLHFYIEPNAGPPGMGKPGAMVTLHAPSGAIVTQTRVLTNSHLGLDFETELPGGLPESGPYTVTVQPFALTGTYTVTLAPTHIQQRNAPFRPLSRFTHTMAITRHAQDAMLVFTGTAGTDVEIRSVGLPSSLRLRDATGADVAPFAPSLFTLESSGAYSVYVNPDNNAIGDVVVSYFVLLPVVDQPISAGYDHTCASINGLPQCWGRNWNSGWFMGADSTMQGNLSLYGDISSTVPVTIAPPAPLGMLAPKYVVAGAHGSCAIDKRGRHFCWGHGHGMWASSAGPVMVSTINGTAFDGLLASINPGVHHICMLTRKGDTWCGGSHYYGQLGVDPARLLPLGNYHTSQLLDIQDPDMKNATVYIEASDWTMCAALLSGGVKCWGDNVEGTLGNGQAGPNLDQDLPGWVNHLNVTVTQVSVSNLHACALLEDGTVRCWGANIGNRQFADVATSPLLTPTLVPDLPLPVRQIQSNNEGTCAVGTSGAVKCWGHPNAYQHMGMPKYELGYETGGATHVAAGSAHVCVQHADNTRACWGSNASGRLGDGSLTDRLVATSTAPEAAILSGAELAYTRVITRKGDTVRTMFDLAEMEKFSLYMRCFDQSTHPRIRIIGPQRWTVYEQTAGVWPQGTCNSTTAALRLSPGPYPAGRYLLEIEPTNNQTGTFMIEFSRPVSDVIVPDGPAVSKAVTHTLQEIWLAFTPTVGQRYNIGINGTGQPVVAGYLIAPGGAQLWTGSNTVPAPMLNHDSAPLAAGIHYIRLAPSNGAVGTYTVTLSTPNSSTVPFNGALAHRTVTRAGQDIWFSAEITSPQVVIAAVNATGAGNARVYLYRPDGSEISSANAQPTTILNAGLVPAGTYYVRIDPFNNALGTYTTTLSTAATGELVLNGPVISRTISRFGQTMWFTFTGAVGQAPSLGGRNTGTGANISVFKPSGGAAYATGQVNPNGDMDMAPLPEAGTYSVGVYPFNGGSGVYTFTLSLPQTGVITPGGAAVSRQITRTGQTIELSFAGRAGQLLTATINGTGSSGANDVINPPTGAALWTGSNNPIANINLPVLAATGPYTIYVNPFNGNSGHYTVSMGILREPVIFTGLVNVTATDNTLTRTAATNAWDGGAISTQRLLTASNGYVEATVVTSTGNMAFGLSAVDTNANFDTIPYAIQLTKGGTVAVPTYTMQVYENGTLRFTQGNFKPGDQFRVGRAGSTVRYFHKVVTATYWTRAFTSTTAANGALFFDSAIFSTTSTLNSAFIGYTLTQVAANTLARSTSEEEAFEVGGEVEALPESEPQPEPPPQSKPAFLPMVTVPAAEPGSGARKALYKPRAQAGSGPTWEQLAGDLIAQANTYSEYTKYYTFLGKRIAMRRVVAGTQEPPIYLHGDHLGSTILATDAAGQISWQARYKPFGELRWSSSAAAPTDHQFHGNEHKTQVTFGIVSMAAREYDPKIGRFLSADTIVPGPGNPQTFNRFAYGLNNPVKYQDPSGHESCLPFQKGCGGGKKYNPFDQCLENPMCGGAGMMPSVGQLMVNLGEFVEAKSQSASQVMSKAIGDDDEDSESGGSGGGGGCGILCDLVGKAAKAVASAAGAAMADGDPTNEARMISEGIQKAQTATSIGYKSFDSFKYHQGGAGIGYAWHHIVSKLPANIAKFGEQAIHNTKNLVRLPDHAGSVHRQLTAYMNSLDFALTGSRTQRVRDWLAQQSWDFQYQWGIDTLTRIASGQGP